MNPLNLSPAGAAFWGSIIRHVLTGLAGILVTHGYVTKSGADAYEEELVGAILYGAAAAWSNRVAYWQQIRQIVAGAMPGPVTATVVDAKVSELKDANALPSVFTPATVSPSLVKPMILLACVLAGAAALSLPACGPKPYHAAVVANTSIAEAIFALQDAEIAAHNAKLITDAKHTIYKAEILTLLQAGDDLTLALKDWNPSQPVPANVGLAIGNVQKLLDDLNLDSPTLSKVIFAAQTVLSVLRGTGVLPAAGGWSGPAGNDAAAVAGLEDRRALWAIREPGREMNQRRATVAIRSRRLGVLHALILLPEVA